MNRKGFELAISTIILLIIGLLVVALIVYALQGGFTKFNRTSGTLLSSVEGSAVKKACELACSGEDSFTYCCHNFTIGSATLHCSDDILKTSCTAVSCAAVQCPAGA